MMVISAIKKVVERISIMCPRFRSEVKGLPARRARDTTNNGSQWKRLRQSIRACCALDSEGLA